MWSEGRKEKEKGDEDEGVGVGVKDEEWMERQLWCWS